MKRCGRWRQYDASPAQVAPPGHAKEPCPLSRDEGRTGGSRAKAAEIVLTARKSLNWKPGDAANINTLREVGEECEHESFTVKRQRPQAAAHTLPFRVAKALNEQAWRQRSSNWAAALSGLRGCNGCAGKGQCVFAMTWSTQVIANRKKRTALFGSPVYYAHPADRFCPAGRSFTPGEGFLHKPAAVWRRPAGRDHGLPGCAE